MSAIHNHNRKKLEEYMVPAHINLHDIHTNISNLLRNFSKFKNKDRNKKLLQRRSKEIFVKNLIQFSFVLNNIQKKLKKLDSTVDYEKTEEVHFFENRTIRTSFKEIEPICVKFLKICEEYQDELIPQNDDTHLATITLEAIKKINKLFDSESEGKIDE